MGKDDTQHRSVGKNDPKKTGTNWHPCYSKRGWGPDLETFASICEWLGEDPSQFLGFTHRANDQTAVSVHMRKKKTTSVATATALGEMIIAAQAAIRDRESL